MAYSSVPTTEDYALAQRAGEMGLPFLATRAHQASAAFVHLRQYVHRAASM